MKKTLTILLAALLAVTSITAAGVRETAPVEEVLPLEGHELMIYCGAGMKDPFTEIADLFEKESGCTVSVIYANGGQIQSQINTSGEGDFFIAGAATELKPVTAHITEVKDLVKHVPVLVAGSGNPYGIEGLDDLVQEGLTFIMGNVEATPIGKIAKKALADRGILKKVEIAATTPTAPMIATAIARGEADAAIIWKENAAGVEGCQIVDTPDMAPYVKTIPAARLDSTADTVAADAFYAFLDGEGAGKIWKAWGYEEI